MGFDSAPPKALKIFDVWVEVAGRRLVSVALGGLGVCMHTCLRVSAPAHGNGHVVYAVSCVWRRWRQSM